MQLDWDSAETASEIKYPNYQYSNIRLFKESDIRSGLFEYLFVFRLNINVCSREGVHASKQSPRILRYEISGIPQAALSSTTEHRNQSNSVYTLMGIF